MERSSGRSRQIAALYRELEPKRLLTEAALYRGLRQASAKLAQTLRDDGRAWSVNE